MSQRLPGYKDHGNESLLYSVSKVFSYNYYKSPFLNTTINRLTIGNNVLFIPVGAFKYSSLHGSVLIPDNVRVIGAGAFKGCGDIDSIYLGCNIESVAGNAFWGCSGIRSIQYNARNCRNAMFYGVSLNLNSNI